MTSQKKVFVIALGCGTNQADASFHAASMVGAIRANTLDEADEVIIQTCGLSPEREQAYHQAREDCERLAPNAKITVGGCLPFITPEAIRAKAASSQIVKPSRLLAHLQASPDAQPEAVLWMSEEKGVGFLRISTGCLDSCNYCSIWKAVGKTKSRPPQLVVRDLRAARDKGLTRVRLVSEDCGAWGQDQGKDLGELLREIRQAHLGLKLTLGTFHPRWLPSLTPALLSFIKDGTLEPMLQVPVQSGSDRMLQKMRRLYRAREAFKNLCYLRDNVPNLELYTDVVVGFPGETAADLCATLALLLTVGFTEVSAFGFYPQANSAASRFEGQLTQDEIKARVRFLTRELLIHDFLRSKEQSWTAYVLGLTDGSRPPPVVFQGNWLPDILSSTQEDTVEYQKLHELAGQMMLIMCGSGIPVAAHAQPNEAIVRFADNWQSGDPTPLGHALTTDCIREPIPPSDQSALKGALTIDHVRDPAK